MIHDRSSLCCVTAVEHSHQRDPFKVIMSSLSQISVFWLSENTTLKTLRHLVFYSSQKYQQKLMIPPIDHNAFSAEKILESHSLACEYYCIPGHKNMKTALVVVHHLWILTVFLLLL